MRRLAALAGVLYLLLATACPAQPADLRHMAFSLTPSRGEVAPGGELTVGITQTPDPGWHSYWRNPGEVGLPTEIRWSLPAAISAGPAEWPAPSLLPLPGGLTFGFAGPATLLVSLHADRDAPIGSRFTVTAHLSSLVCADFCEPVDADLELPVTITATPAATDRAVTEARSALPRRLDHPAAVTRTPDGIAVAIDLPQGGGEAATAADAPFLFLESATLFAATAPQRIEHTDGGLKLSIAGRPGPWPPGGTAAVLRMDSSHSYAVILPPPGEASISTEWVELLTAGVLAFVGGVILNLMPCVFPILSIKLLALVRIGENPRQAWRETLSYSGGVMASFAALALGLALLRWLGSAAGWGFQLQSPAMTGGLAIVMMLVALNFSGLFETGTALQALGGKVDLSPLRHRPILMSFATGILAVIVAAPCSAPFMATAVGVALGRGGTAALAIFLSLGAGFAAPMVAASLLLGRYPGLIGRLPRPGRWTQRLRAGLAVPMYLSAGWLGWVFWHQTDLSALATLVLAAGAVAVIFWRVDGWRRIALTSAAVALMALSVAVKRGGDSPVPGRDGATVAFSQDALQELRQAGRPVLVDVTADWCITCKFNEQLVLKNSGIQSEISKTNTAYMVADWTSQDNAIGKYIRSLGRSSIPIYIYYGRNQDPIILPQILTVSLLKDILDGRA